MFMDDAARRVFSLQQLCKLAIAGVNDLGTLKSETKPLSQAVATKQRQKLQTRAVQKSAPPPVASTKPSTAAPKPLDISMPKMASLRKLQLLLTKKAYQPHKYANVVQPTRQAVRDYLLNWNQAGAFDTDNYEDLEENLPWATNAWRRTADNDPVETFQLDTNQLARRFLLNRSREKAVNNYINKHFAHLPAEQASKTANVIQPPNNYRLLPTAPNITTTTPVQRAQNLHADKLPGASAIKSTIQDNGPISTVGNVNGNAGQGVRAGGMKLAVDKLAKLLVGFA